MVGDQQELLVKIIININPHLYWNIFYRKPTIINDLYCINQLVMLVRWYIILIIIVDDQLQMLVKLIIYINQQLYVK